MDVAKCLVQPLPGWEGVVGEVLYSGGFSCSGIHQGPQGASGSREDRTAAMRVSQGAEHVPLEGTSPAGHPVAACLLLLGVQDSTLTFCST